jgi:hypothetical protein
VATFRHLSVGNGLRECIRFQVPAVRAPERFDWNGLIFFQLETCPETRLRFPWRPALSLNSTVCVIRHPAGLHVRVTPYALDRSFHIHLPEEAANSVTRRPNYGQSSYRLAVAITRSTQNSRPGSMSEMAMFRQVRPDFQFLMARLLARNRSNAKPPKDILHFLCCGCQRLVLCAPNQEPQDNRGFAQC